MSEQRPDRPAVSVTEAFAARRAATPDRPAVTGAYGTATYGELGRRADAVAASVRAVQQAAGRTDVRIGYLGDRTMDFPALVLGVLAAGAAYVPLDPSWPPARLAEVAAAAGLSRVYTGPGHTALAEGAALAHVAPLADVLTAPGTAPALRWSGTGRELAYLVFTSGTSGAPKAVATEHRALANNCRGVAHRWGLGENDRVLQFTPLGTDISLEEMFSAWTSGGAVVLMAAETATDLGRFTRFLARHQVSAVDLPASFWSTWLSLVEAGDVPPPPAELRVVAVGSEEVAADDIARWLTVCGPHGRFFNMYGSTEQAVTSVVHGPLAPADPAGAGVIGTPLPGVHAYVLDDRWQPVPPGVPGELHIGGLAVARGYLGDAGRTAARFRPDPFTGEPGARMYATGDAVVALADGSLRFVGRIDRRLKINGFTVQPAEVEARLAALPGVLACAVSAEPGPDGRDRLVADLRTGADADTAALLAAVAQRAGAELPGPSRPGWVRLHGPGTGEPALLRVPSGRDQAPHRAAEQEVPAAALAAVTALWQELLGGQEIGPHDSFLDLGGNSLMSAQLLTRLRSRFGVEMSYGDFFQDPTVTRMAAEVAAAPGPGASGETPASAAVELPRLTTRQAPAWPGQERMWFLQQNAPDSRAYHIPLAFRIDGPLDEAALESALREVVRRHEPLRTGLAFDGAGIVQQVHDVDLAWEVHDVGADASDLLAEFTDRPFDLGGGRVFRAALLRQAGGHHLLTLVVHHVAFDEWSAGIVLDEISALYNAAVDGRSPDLPPLTVRYAEFSAWQSSVGFRRRVAERLGFWREHLAGLPLSAALGGDREPPARRTGAGAAHTFTVPARQAAALDALARREGVTRYQVLLTVFTVFLAHHTGRFDLAVGVPSTNRAGEDLERLVGLFVNTLPVRADLDDNPRFAEAARRVGRSLVAAQEAGDVPFDEIVRAVGARGDRGGNPLVRSMFLMDTPHPGALSLAGAAVSPVGLPVRSSTMDLTLVLGDAEDGLTGRLWYSSELFDAETAGLMAQRLLALIDHVTQDPDIRVKDAELAVGDDRSVVSAPAAAGAAARVPVALRIAETAAHRPHDIAVDGAGRLTYRELLDRVEAVRTALRPHLADAPFVPLVLPAGVAMLTAMIAVNSLGRAFVPVDPEWPAARRALVLADTGSPCAVATGGRRKEAGVELLDMTDFPAARHGDSPWELTAEDLDRPMYAIYTSGSTGRPKGAVALHRGIANRFAWMDDEFGAKAAEVVLQTTAPFYDSCVWEYLWPLTHGGRTVLGGVTAQAVPERLLGLVREHGVRTVDLVPGVLAQLLDHMADDPVKAAALSSLRVAVAGGEELGQDVAARFARLGLPGRLYNLYGPTEASIGSMFHPLSGPPQGRVVIGRPITGTGAVVLDARRRVVPRGVVGELYLAGRCVGGGYLADPQGTRARFVENRFGADVPGDRLYRTGDLVRLRRSGEMEFHGRADDETKVRGVRIAPAEVEAAVLSHPAVRAAVVLAVPARTGTQLRDRVAALLAAAPVEVAAAALRRVTHPSHTSGQ